MRLEEKGEVGREESRKLRTFYGVLPVYISTKVACAQYKLSRSVQYQRDLYYFGGVNNVTSILVNELVIRLVFLLSGSATELEYDDVTCLCNPNCLNG